MIINEKAQKAIEAKDEAALIAGLQEAGYDESAARYLAGKLLGTITDDHEIL